MGSYFPQIRQVIPFDVAITDGNPDVSFPLTLPLLVGAPGNVQFFFTSLFTPAAVVEAKRVKNFGNLLVGIPDGDPSGNTALPVGVLPENVVIEFASAWVVPTDATAATPQNANTDIAVSYSIDTIGSMVVATRTPLAPPASVIAATVFWVEYETYTVAPDLEDIQAIGMVEDEENLKFERAGTSGDLRIVGQAVEYFNFPVGIA